MRINRVVNVFFSPCGSTKRVAQSYAVPAARLLEAEYIECDVTLPDAREMVYCLEGDDLLVFAVPTYAGRIPNKILPFVQEGLIGSGTAAVALVTFGNRSYDSSLLESVRELEGNGFIGIGAAAIVCEHVFSEKLAPGRPDSMDLALIDELVSKTTNFIKLNTGLSSALNTIFSRGEEVAPYYIPKGDDGLPVKFLKAKPKTITERCNHCGVCVDVCPMNAIESGQEEHVPGTCIKCQACIKGCKRSAKYFDDPAFLSHVRMLEEEFKDRVESKIFL